MSSYIYCLYSTADGLPRYVGRAEDKVSYRFRQHVTAALEKEAGPLYDWIRDVWRKGDDVAVYTLQENIIPKDVAMFERYWMGQFSNLLNIVGNSLPAQTDTSVGSEIKRVLQAQIQLARRAPDRHSS